MKVSELFKKQIENEGPYPTRFQNKCFILDRITPQVAIDFARWLQCHDNGDILYNPETGQQSPSIGFSPFDCWMDNIMTIGELFERFLKQYKPNE